MFTLFPYLCCGFYLGFVTRSVGLPVLAYVLYHFCFWRPLFGTGAIDETAFDAYYTIAYTMHAIAGFTLAWSLNVPKLMLGHNRPLVVCDPHSKVISKQSTRTRNAVDIAVCAYRGVLGSVLLLCIYGATMIFEFIPLDLVYLSIVIVLVAFGIILVLFWLCFTNRLAPHNFKLRQAIYFFPDKRCNYCCTDMTGDCAVYMAFYFVATTIVFCLVTALVPAGSVWTQYYTAYLLFAVAEIFFGVCRFWVRPRGDKPAAATSQ